MPVFTPPTRTDWSFAEGQRPPEARFWAHFGTQPRGRSVIKIDGTWTTVDWPTMSQVSNATRIIDVNGESVPGAFLGGHIAQITDAVAAELTAAGYGANIT